MSPTNAILLSALVAVVCGLLSNVIASWIEPKLRRYKVATAGAFGLLSFALVWATLPKNEQAAVQQVSKAGQTGTVSPQEDAGDCSWDSQQTIEDCILELKERKRSPQLARMVAFEGRGRWHLACGDFNEAELDLTVAIEAAPDPSLAISFWLDPKDASDLVGSKRQMAILTHYLRGVARINLGRYSEALQDCDVPLPSLSFRYRKATRLTQMQGECRGIALSMLDRHLEAVPLLTQTIERAEPTWLTFHARSQSRKALMDSAGAEMDAAISKRMKTTEVFAPAWESLR